MVGSCTAKFSCFQNKGELVANSMLADEVRKVFRPKRCFDLPLFIRCATGNYAILIGVWWKCGFSHKLESLPCLSLTKVAERSAQCCRNIRSEEHTSELQ